MNESGVSWEQELLSAGAASFEYPATPGLRAAVLLRAEARHGWRSMPLVRRAGLAVAALAVIAAGVTAILPGPRDAVAGWLGLRVEGAVIERLPHGVDQLPEPVPLDEFATLTDLESAKEMLGFEPVLVGGFGEPESVLVIDYAGDTFAVLIYDDFDLWQSDGGGFFGKGLPEGTVLTELAVNGASAYWMQGGPHLVTFFGDDGEPVAGSVRTVLRNTLLLRTESRFYRIETELGLEYAVSIAESLP